MFQRWASWPSCWMFRIKDQEKWADFRKIKLSTTQKWSLREIYTYCFQQQVMTGATFLWAGTIKLMYHHVLEWSKWNPYSRFKLQNFEIQLMRLLSPSHQCLLLKNKILKFSLLDSTLHYRKKATISMALGQQHI